MLGQLVVSSFLQVLFQAAASLLQQELKLVQGLEEETKTLSNNVSLIQARLSEVEERQQEESVRQFLGQLRDIAYDAVDVLEELAYEVKREELVHFAKMRRISSPINMKRMMIKNEMAHKMKDLSQSFDNLYKTAGTIGLKVGDRSGGARKPAEADESRTSTSLPPSHVFGREDDKARIIRMLLGFDSMLEQDIPVIPILGMCGVGKTTLAQLVYNDEDVKQHFDLRLWVDVSHDFNEKRVAKSILESINGSATDRDLCDLQRQLQEKLTGKRYLLVLDNAWKEKADQWKKFKLPLGSGAVGSKILVTTRNSIVAKIMGTVPPYSLQCLSDDDCWTLFCHHVEQNPYELLDMDDIPKQILNMSKGLPLAAISIGNQLIRVNDRRMWKSILKGNLQHSRGCGSDFQRSISLTYEKMPPQLKPCFAYCSVIPKGVEFEKDYIIQLWATQNLIQSKEEPTEDLGSHYFDTLVLMSLIECARSDEKGAKCKYRMPQVFHDLAQNVSGEEFCIVEIGNPCSDKTRHLSVVSRPETRQRNPSIQNDIIFKEILQCKGLHTLVLFGGSNINNLEVPHNLAAELKRLRTLDLSNSDLKVLPDSIGNLKHLRCLQLRNTNLSSLPDSIGKLYFLEILGLGNCYSLEMLPRNTKNLRKLRHLDLHLDDKSVENVTRLRSVPPDIGLLTDLQTLSRFVIGSDTACGLTQLGNLKSLRGELTVSNLHLVWSQELAAQARMTDKMQIQSLHLQWISSASAIQGSGNDQKVLAALKPHENLEKLTVIGYRGPSFPSWLGDSAFTRLEELCLSNCHNCSSLPPLGSIPTLKQVQIKGMTALKVIDCNFLCKPDGTISNLEKLVFESMRSLQVWYGENECALGSLRELVFIDCTDLRQLVHNFPHLSKLKIQGCQNLLGLRSFPSLKSLAVVGGGNWIWQSWPCLTSLTSLTLSRLPVESFPSDASRPHASLNSLEISHCDKLKTLPNNWLPVGLVNLRIKHCDSLLAIPTDFENLTELEELEIQTCFQLRSLPDLNNMRTLMRMDISSCPRLPHLPRMPVTLKLLSINNCPNLKQRCENERGADWCKLAHVLSLWIDERLVISRG